MENWMQFKLIGSRVHIKKDVVPRKFINQRKPEEQTPSQLSSSSRKRRLETLQNMRDVVKRRVCFDDSSTSCEMPSTSLSSPTMLANPGYTEVESPSGTFLTKSTPKLKDAGVTKTDELSGNLSSDSHYYSLNMSKAKCNYVDKRIQVRIKPQRRSIGTITPKVCTRSCGTSTILDEPKGTVKCNTSESSLSSTTTNISDFIPSSSNIENTSDGTDSGQHFAVHVDHKGSLKNMSRFYLGLPPETYFLIETITKYVNISSRDILICLKKIRLNDANVRIADDFSISKSYVSKIFNKTVPILASIFKQFIVWQSAFEIQAHLPIAFRYRYRKVQSIINCLEIEVDISSDAEKQAQTWSQYKHCNTVKYLISATPHGLINYISPGFGGRATDRIIVEKSGFLEVLPKHAHVLADRGSKQINSVS